MTERLSLTQTLKLPHRSKGRQSAAAKERFRSACEKFCRLILDIRATLDFDVSRRGWCYILEEHGLGKGEFDAATKLLDLCRKSGQLPLDICCEDEGRKADHLESLDDETPEEYADGWIEHLKEHAHESYTPISFWEALPVYIEMVVEKIDLKSLFDPICEQFHIAIRNAGGWGDIPGRAVMMRRFQEWEGKGKQCVLLYCGDHDPVGLHMSNRLRKGFEELKGAVGWDPANLIITRFGLNYDFIEEQGLTWIDGLETGSGMHLEDPGHHLANADYVQDYIRQFGERKCEANALVVRPDAGRALCRDAIREYVPDDAIGKYERGLKSYRRKVKEEIRQRLVER
jgi:hypothetical protein